MAVPAGVTAMADRGPDWARWVRSLPATVTGLLRRWTLHADGSPTHGHCSIVLPVRTEENVAAVLKVGFPDEESEHEHLALRRWAGDGAVRLLAADPSNRALLLERLRSRDLTAVPDLEACRIVAGLYPRIHLAPLPQARSLAELVGHAGAGLRALPRSAPVPRRLVEQAIAVGTDLAADGSVPGRLLHGDLHYSNVLAANVPAGNVLAGNVAAADRGPWLVIDPKPVNGDPHYDIAPMLWNRFTEMRPDVRSGVRRRLWTLVEAAGLDEDRARGWVLVRMVHNAMWELDGPRVDRDRLTVCIAVAKAVSD